MSGDVKAETHHRSRREVAPGVWEVVRPLRDTSWWHQWRRQRRCRRETGHCWHPEGLVDWWCCECSGETDGTPPQRCVYCTAPTLMLTRGLPASGKTTWARTWVAEQPAVRARVNRDDLRDMLFGGWTGDRGHEDAVTAVQHVGVAALLAAGLNVVCDDTNLHDEHVAAFRDLAARVGAVVRAHDLTGVAVDTCVERDAARAARGERHVGEQVIRGMWRRHLATGADGAVESMGTGGVPE